MRESARSNPLMQQISGRSLVARLLAATLAALIVASAFADDVEDRRANAGVRLFRALLSADIDLPKKTVAPNTLLIVFFYVDDERRARDLAARFVQESKEIRGLTVTTEVMSDATLEKIGPRSAAGIFLAQAPPRKSIASIIRFGIAKHVIVYSPFEGHVELGVLGGLSVEAQVRPFLNHATLESSQISLKPLFLSVAKVYQ
jgi:hypothetical protein